MFRPTDLSAVDELLKKYRSGAIALMGAMAKRYLDGAQAANMLKAVLNLQVKDKDSFDKEYLEHSLRAADKLMDDLRTGDPPADPPGLTTFGKPKRDPDVSGRKADQDTPSKPQRSRCARQQSTAPASRRARSTTPARSSWEGGKGSKLGTRSVARIF